MRTNCGLIHIVVAECHAAGKYGAYDKYSRSVEVAALEESDAEPDAEAAPGACGAYGAYDQHDIHPRP